MTSRPHGVRERIHGAPPAAPARPGVTIVRDSAGVGTWKCPRAQCEKPPVHTAYELTAEGRPGRAVGFACDEHVGDLPQ